MSLGSDYSKTGLDTEHLLIKSGNWLVWKLAEVFGNCMELYFSICVPSLMSEIGFRSYTFRKAYWNEIYSIPSLPLFWGHNEDENVNCQSLHQDVTSVMMSFTLMEQEWTTAGQQLPLHDWNAGQMWAVWGKYTLNLSDTDVDEVDSLNSCSWGFENTLTAGHGTDWYLCFNIKHCDMF